MMMKKSIVLGMAAGALCLSNLTANANDILNLSPGNLMVTRSVYSGTAATVTIGQTLPGGGTAVVDGSYPYVWGNEAPDASFGVTAPVMLDQYTTSGTLLNSFNLTNAFADQGLNFVTSFSSKSEMAINESANGALILMGYVSPINTLDVSNSNTPNHIDPTNPVAAAYPRAVAQINTNASLQVTPVNTYSGNNGRAAVLAGGNYYTVGNAGNGSGTEPTNIVNNTGVQMTTPGGGPETTVVGTQQGTPGSKNGFEYGYSVVLNGDPADKSGKDDNFRGLTVFNNTLYATKGSGSNGINTVYQVGTVGSLPTTATASTTGITILPGFSTALASAKSTPSNPVYHPFGIWFANANTLYMGDEGDGVAYSSSSKTHYGGIQKWIYNGSTWSLAYILQNGLNLGTQYSVTNYPSALNPASDGIRNITGTVNGDGTVTIYGITSTVSASTDQGADPNQLVTITDTLADQTASDAAGESFTTLATANYGEVLRGVAFTMFSTTVGTDISSQVNITTSNLVYSRAKKLYSGILTVTNTSSATITGNLTVTLDDLTSGVTLTNATGSNSGFPTIGSVVSLAPGASATLTMTFSNPNNLLINFNPLTTIQ
jgi:uncharacterized cupredoxin-like copper-binding protein